jgi:hypothetical protein
MQWTIGGSTLNALRFARGWLLIGAFKTLKRWLSTQL